MKYYQTLDDETPHKKLVNAIFGEVANQYSFFNQKISQKIALLKQSIEIKQNNLANFYTPDKIKQLLSEIINKANDKSNDGFSNQLLEYKNYLKTDNQHITYGKKIIREVSFSKFTEHENNIENTFSTTDILKLDQIQPSKRQSFIVNPSSTLKNSDIFMINEDQQKQEQYHYISMSYIKNSYSNTSFNVSFALLRIKFNLAYKNKTGPDAHNIIKKYFFINDDGKKDTEVTEHYENDEDNMHNSDINKFNMPSEFIDLGIGHYTDYNYKHMIHHLDKFEKTLSCISYNEDLQDFIIGYSMNYLAYDIYQMLWHQTPIPWGDPKYAKRLDRFFMVVMYDFIRHNFINNNNNITDNQNKKFKIFEEIYNDIHYLIQNIDEVNATYNEKLKECIEKYFEYPEIISSSKLFYKLNEFDINYLLVAKEAYSYLGDIVKTILHFIYNIYVIKTFDNEHIYNFYFNSCERSNFEKTLALQNYLGRDNNGDLIQRPRPNTDLDIITDLKKYLKTYSDKLISWYNFFNEIIFTNPLDHTVKNNLLQQIFTSGIKDVSNQTMQLGGKSKVNITKTRYHIPTNIPYKPEKYKITKHRFSRTIYKPKSRKLKNPIYLMKPKITLKNKPTVTEIDTSIDLSPMNFTSDNETYQYINFNDFSLFDESVNKKYHQINMETSFNTFEQL